MMNKQLFLPALVFSCFTAYSQTTFQRTFGGTGSEVGYSIQQTNDNGFIITGQTQSYGAGSDDIYLLKTDSDGMLQWKKTFGGSSGEDGQSVLQTADGGYVVAGATRSFGTGSDDAYLLKTDSDGSLLWTKTYGGTNVDGFRSVRQTPEGGFAMLGSTISFGSGSTDFFLVKTDSDGTLQWEKNFGTANSNNGHFLQLTNDGGFILNGFIGNNGGDLYMVKTDSDGNQQWTTTFGGTNDDAGREAMQTGDGGYIATGSTSSFGAGSYDVYLVRVSSGGTVQWSKTFGGTKDDYGYSVRSTADGGFVLGCATLSFGSGGVDAWLIKTTSDGSLQWSRTFGGSAPDMCSMALQVNDGGFAVTGHAQSFGSASEVYLVKTDASGNSGCNESTPLVSVNSGGTAGTGGAQGTGAVVTGPVSMLVNTGGNEISLCSTVGMSEAVPENSMQIFPNPFSSSTTLYFQNDLKDAALTLYNSLGSLERQMKNINGHTITLQRANLPSGIYFLYLYSGSQVVARNLLILTDN